MATTAMRRSLIKAFVLLIIPTVFLLHQSGHWPTTWSRQLNPQFLSNAVNTTSLNMFTAEKVHRPMSSNLVAQSEGKHFGPWSIVPPLPPTITTDEFEIRFQCLWHPDDLCPKRYVVILRGPVIYTPPVEDYKVSEDGIWVSVKIKVPEPGEYQFWAFPDFQQCPAVWRETMRYPWNRGLVQGSPTFLTVTGPPTRQDNVKPCTLGDLDGSKELEGRWVSRKSLLKEFDTSKWAQSFNQTQDYVYQPLNCKRSHLNATALRETTNVSGLFVLGDSVLRGAFCTQIWPSMSQSGLADGDCTYKNDAALYTTSKKNIEYTTKKGKKVHVAFRFLDDKPLEKLEDLVAEGLQAPSHIITNIGLWLAPMALSEYEDILGKYMDKLYQLYPKATVVWRTTTDVAPMIQCFGDKGMTRDVIFQQREISLKMAKRLRNSGMNLYVVDGYDMTRSRPDAGNDGRHWVIESAEEYRWLPGMRPSINQAESAIMDAVWEVIVQDDLHKAAEKDELF